MVTHNPNLTTYASRVITMLDGKIDTDTFRLPLPSRETAKRPLGETSKPKKTLRKKKEVKA
jgi:ABC-type lipoprotein export system ATPase subunit